MEKIVKAEWELESINPPGECPKERVVEAMEKQSNRSPALGVGDPLSTAGNYPSQGRAVLQVWQEGTLSDYVPL